MSSSKDNLFDSTRHVAAWMVLYSHHFALNGFSEPRFLGLHSFGGLAVVIFFAISGYLVTKSFQRSDNFLDYMSKRIRRIFPAMVVCSLLLVYFVLPFYLARAPLDHLTSLQALKSFAYGGMLLGVRHPEAFGDFIYPNVINGSLWTLPVEFACYILAGFALALNRTWKAPLVLMAVGIAGIMVVEKTGLKFNFYAVPLERLVMFLMVFSAGSLMALSESAWRPGRFRAGLAIASLLVLLVLQGRPEMRVLGNLALSVLTVIICTSFRERIMVGKFDYSYGIYIYAFPVQQMVINGLSLGFYVEMAVATVITVALAMLSWHIVEKPFLRRSRPALAVQAPVEAATTAAQAPVEAATTAVQVPAGAAATAPAPEIAR